MNPIDIAIVGSYILYAVYTGVTSKEESTNNLEEYFLAGRSLPGWQAGVSMAATQFAADTPLMVTGLIATAGVFSLWRLWVYGLAFLLLGFLLSACWRRANVITDAELTELRYGAKPALMLRGFKAIYLGTIFNCTVLAMVMLAATRITEPFLIWHEWLPEVVYQPFYQLVTTIGTPITVVGNDAVITELDWLHSANNLISIICIAMITTFYSTTGGLRNVIKMDIFQFGLMMVSTALFAWFLIDATGGMHAMITTLKTMFATQGPMGMTADQILAFTPAEAKDVTWSLITLLAIQWIAQINSDGTGYLAQRTMACRSEKDAKIAALLFTFFQIVLRSLLWVIIGVGLLVLFVPDLSVSEGVFTAQREATYIRGIVELMPVGLMGLLITGMLAALGSTVDTHLNWGSSYWTNDIFKRIICESILKKDPNPKMLVWVARISNVMILLLALAIMTQLSSIQEAWKVSLLLGAGLGVILILRWVWWRINAWSEITTILISLMLAPFLLGTLADHDAIRLIVLAVVSTVGGIIAAYMFGPETDDTLNKFYTTVRPPGFWGPVAKANGVEPWVDRLKLKNATVAIIGSAISMFAMLTAIGTWLCESPYPAFMPSRVLWVVSLFILSVAIIPAWWKAGFETSETPLQDSV